MPVDKEFVRLYRATVEGVCRARAFPVEFHDLKSCAWTRIVERQKSIFRAKPENRRAYVRMVAASAVIDWLKKKSPPAFYALTPEDLERALPHFAGIGLSPEVLEKSGLLNQQFFERKDFVNAARAIIGYGDKTALFCGMLARLALKRADVRAYVENADEPDEGDDEGFMNTSGDREDPWEPETGDGSMPVRPLGPSEGISPEDGDAALCLVSAFKGFPPGLPIAAVSELKFQKENGPGSFALAVTDRGRSVCLTFKGDRKADVEARGYSAAVSRQGSGRFTVDLAQELELLIRSGAGESTLTLSATDVAEISDAPALLAIYADAASGRSARELQKRRKDVLSGLQGERRSLFAAALDALTLEAAPLTLHLGGPRPSENRRRQWREILGSLALTGHLDDLAARPCLAPFKEDLSLVFGLVTDGLVNEAERRVSGVIASLGDAILPGEPDQQALGYLYALDGWLLVCQQEHERALLVFNRVLGFHGACPGADLAPWARSAHYFADMGGRVATRFIREPETPFREAVFSSLVECLA
ncbi:MAG: hypothetical protein HZB23_02930 [Deltaproteobacteria bacterium]|nr:hypothetical protein [Deltaproteobacteria bacterium]